MMRFLPWLVVTCFFLDPVIAQANVISYLRFEENGGGAAWDETGLLNGDLIAFGDTSPGGGGYGV
ncbi:MAG: hypothetical protein KJ626_08860, partial [Verrucomicrobia bacterium]|nr:hypothetical protein [Verrucomicrobiota bacterium]